MPGNKCRLNWKNIIFLRKYLLNNWEIENNYLFELIASLIAVII